MNARFYHWAFAIYEIFKTMFISFSKVSNCKRDHVTPSKQYVYVGIFRSKKF